MQINEKRDVSVLTERSMKWTRFNLHCLFLNVHQGHPSPSEATVLTGSQDAEGVHGYLWVRNTLV